LEELKGLLTSVTGVDKDRNSLEDAGHKAVERLHPVALEEEIAVDIEIAALVAVNLCA